MYMQVLNAVSKVTTNYGHVLESFHGIAVSYNFTFSFNKEKEVKQGGNEYFGALFQMGEVMTLMEVINQIALVTIQSTRRQTQVSYICNIAIVLSVPICLFLAIVKQGHYPSVADWWNNKYSSIKFPNTFINLS